MIIAILAFLIFSMKTKAKIFQIKIKAAGWKFIIFVHQTKIKRMMGKKPVLTLHTKLLTSLLFKLMVSGGLSDCELWVQRIMIYAA